MSNLFLASLPPKDYEALEPHLKPIDLPIKMLLYEMGEPIDHCYFPSRRTILSEVIGLADGSQIEAGIIGREGFAGVSALLPGNTAPSNGVVQVAGCGMRIRPVILRD